MYMRINMIIHNGNYSYIYPNPVPNKETGIFANLF